MNKIVAVLAALLLVSPAFAAKPKKDDTPKESTCHSLEYSKKHNMAENSRIEYELTGDDLKKFNDFIISQNADAHPPEGQTALVIISTPGARIWTGAIFVKDCLTQIFPLNPESVKRIMAKVFSKGDDSI